VAILQFGIVKDSSAIWNPEALPVPVKSVQKALGLLCTLLFDDPGEKGVTLSALAEPMGMPRNTAHNLLKTMQACGFVAQTPLHAYTAGPLCRQIGRLNHLKSLPVDSLIMPALERLSALIREAVVFAALAGGRRIHVASVDSGHAIRVDHARVEHSSIYALPTGRVLLAWADEDEREAVLAQSGYPADRWNGITDRAALGAALAEVRKAGHSVLDPDTLGLVSLACPVFGPGHVLIGALGCYAPEFRCPAPVRKEILAALNVSALALGKRFRARVET